MPSVSAIVLTRDNQRTIEACIQALKPTVDHVIVVDTGSTDNTVQIAKANGAYVYHFEWCDDFSAARNFGDSLVTTDWVIHVDSDEILRPEDTDKIRKLCMQYRKTTVPVVLAIEIAHIKPDSLQVSSIGRMYKRGVFFWKGIIHEQPYVKRGANPQLVHTDAGVIHDGYNSDSINLREKLARNITLLEKGVEQEPNNAAYRYFLGRDYTIIEDYQTAIPHLLLALDLLEQQNMVNPLEYAHKLAIECLEAIGDYSKAKEIAQRMVSKFNYADGWYENQYAAADH